MAGLSLEQLDQLAEGGDIRWRARAVIARWLKENYGDAGPDDYAEAAKDLIKVMTSADLVTVGGEDLRMHMRDVAQRARAKERARLDGQD